MASRRVVVMVFAVAGLLIAALLATRGSSSAPVADSPSNPRSQASPPSGQIAGDIKLSRERGPLTFGEPVTLAEAESRAGVHLARPNSRLANDSTVLSVFYETRSFDEGPDSYLVAIDYEAGIIVMVHPASYDEITDPGATYREMADGLNLAAGSSIASVKTILGVPALVIQRSANGVPAVDLVLSDGLRVQLIAAYAPDMDASTVEAIAETLA